MEKEKIIFIITKSNWGGAQRYVFDIANSIKSEYEVVVAAGGNGLLFEKLNEVGIKTINIPHLERDIKAWNEPRAIKNLIDIISTEKPNVIHLNSPKAVLLGALAGRIYNSKNKDKVKIIQTIHGFPFIEPRSFIWRTAMWIASYISLLLSHKNIFVSKKDLILSKWMPFTSGKNIYIPNGISSINFLSKDEARLKLLGSKYDGFLIGTIAELNHNKGIEFLIKSLSYLKDHNIQSIIIGEGEKRKELEDLSIKTNAPVKFTGMIPGASEYLKAFDVFVLPSLKEGLPYVLIEAGAAGLPVISTAVGGIPHLIQSGTSGTLVPPKDSKALSAAIEPYLKDKSTRELHAKNLKQIVEKNYNLETTVQTTKQLYSWK